MCDKNTIGYFFIIGRPNCKVELIVELFCVILGATLKKSTFKAKITLK